MWIRRNVLKYDMKCTQYFSFLKGRPDRATIKEKWILETITNPLKQEIQSDGRIRKWSYIADVGKYLRVIILDDGETVHNAFFDRNFKEEGK
jgi:hypothetical protein